MKNQKGYTLKEMSIVLAVVIVAAGAALGVLGYFIGKALM
jgi:prepilin-type N-terminal cleavage/methylation domain-containing protein